MEKEIRKERNQLEKGPQMETRGEVKKIEKKGQKNESKMKQWRLNIVAVRIYICVKCTAYTTVCARLIGQQLTSVLTNDYELLPQ